MENIGGVLKIIRTEKNITQNELCKEICTPSYLSRIENNLLIANDEIYRLLFKKLGINYDNVIDTISNIDDRIENLYEDLLNGNRKTKIFEELEQAALYAGGEAYLKYRIVYCRYLIEINNTQQAKILLNDLKKVIEPNNKRSFFLYINVLMLYLILEKNYLKAIDSGLELSNVKDIESYYKEYQLGIFYYNLALCYKNLNLYDESYLSVKQALGIFKDGYYLERALDCQILLGITYNNLKKYNKAIDSYSSAYRILNYLNNDDSHSKYLGYIYNNLGYCYECQEEYEKAIKHYIKSLQHKKDKDSIRTLINLIRCNYLTEDIEKAKHWLHIGLELQSNITPRKHKLQLEIFTNLLSLNDILIDDIVNIQVASIKYFTSCNLWDLAIRYGKIFAQLYEKHKYYKKASEMYKLILKIDDKLIIGGNDR